MDKKVLNEEELSYLKKFIMSRGFKDTGTIHEILDHLACKVEEIMTAAPALQLEEAVKKAHASFGVRGFRDIAAAYEDQLRTRYLSVYKQDILTSLKHPLHLLVLVAIGFLCYQSFTWMAVNRFHHLLGAPDYTWIALVISAGLDVFLLRQAPKGGRHNLIFQLAMTPTNFYWFPYLMFCVANDAPISHTQILVSVLLFTFLIVFSIVNFKARMKALEKAKADYYLQKRLA